MEGARLGTTVGCGQGWAGAFERGAAPNPRTPEPPSSLSGPGTVVGPQFPQTGNGRRRMGIPAQWPLSVSEAQDFLSSAAPGLTGAVLPNGRESYPSLERPPQRPPLTLTLPALEPGLERGLFTQHRPFQLRTRAVRQKESCRDGLPMEGHIPLWQDEELAKQQRRKGIPGRRNSMGRDVGVRERPGHLGNC